MIPLDQSYQDRSSGVQQRNTAEFPDVEKLIPSGGFHNDLALYISDYYLNSALNLAFSHDLLSVIVPYIDLDTTVLDAALLN